MEGYMGACEVLNLVLKIFASFSNVIHGDALSPFILQSVYTSDVQEFFPLDFAVWGKSTFQDVWILALQMHP